MTTIQELKDRLSVVTDSQEYDRIQAEIAHAEKEAVLAANKAAAEERARSAKELAARLRRFEAAKVELQKGRAEAAELDGQLFDDLANLYERLILRHRLEVSLYEKGDSLNTDAEALSQPQIDNPRMTCLGLDVHGLGGYEAIGRILSQYNDSASQIADAKRIGKPAPTKPEMDWYSRGDGRYWPGKM